VAVFQANIDNRAAQPQIQQAILNVALEAAALYWEWVSAGQKLEAQRELLDLAEVRDEQLRAGVNADKFPAVDLVFNQQLIAERRGSLLEAERKYRSIGFKLGLFLRDELGQRIIPMDDWLPKHFPQIEPLNNQNFDADLAAAVARRPEPQLLRLEVNRLQQDQRLASNQLLPKIDLLAEGSQDVGTPTSSKNDKGQFELLVGLMGEMPIQRRKYRGKLQSTAAKIAQVNQKLRLQVDKIATELLIANNALNIAAQVVDQEQIALTASLDTLNRYRFAFTRGKTDLIYINFLETKTNENEIKLIDAQRAWFSALADMQRSLGLDPLEQAVNISNLPASTLSGPGYLPDLKAPAMETLEEEPGLRQDAAESQE
jgi:outer membrane protein TolC